MMLNPTPTCGVNQPDATLLKKQLSASNQKATNVQLHEGT